MADKDNIWEDNTPGNWFVDKNCILCSLCGDIAPDNFREADSGDHDIVYKQPESPEEIAACQDALDQCPVESIGKDRHAH